MDILLPCRIFFTWIMAYYDVQVVIDNGILKVTISNPGGIVTGIQYKNVDNLLQADEDDQIHRGYN